MPPFTSPLRPRRNMRRHWSFHIPSPEEARQDKELAFRGPRHQHHRYTAKTENPLTQEGKPDAPGNSDSNIEERVIDVHSTGKDATVHVDVEVQIDPTEDIAELARLNRLGWFKQAEALYEEKLKNHLDVFPVVAEYADLLLQQGNYEATHRLISKCFMLQAELVTKERFAWDEMMVLTAIKAYADILCKGQLDSARDNLSDMRAFLEFGNFDSLTGTKIHVLELYFQIMSFVKYNSAPNNRMRYSDNRGPSPVMYEGRWGDVHFDGLLWTIFPLHLLSFNSFGAWYRKLSEHGFYWESFRFLRLVLSTLKEEEYYRSFHDEIEIPAMFTVLMQVSRIDGIRESFMRLDDIFSCDDEQLVLTELATASLIEDFLTTTLPKYSETIDYCLDRERSLASLILDKYQHMSTSRPFVEWLFKEQVRALPKTISTTSTSTGYLMFLSFEHYLNIKLVNQYETLSSGSKRAHFANLQKMLKNAENVGDLLLQRTILQDMIQSGDSISERLQASERLADLLLNKMVDLVGYVEYLVGQYIFIDKNLSDMPDKQAKAKATLCEEIYSFDRSYPSYSSPYYRGMRFDSYYSMEISFMHLPLSEYLMKQIQIRLFADLHRDKERLMAELQLNNMKYDLPCYDDTGPDWNLVMDQRLLDKHDVRQDWELLREQQEIDRLERELARKSDRDRIRALDKHDDRQDWELLIEQQEIDRLERELERDRIRAIDRRAQYESHHRDRLERFEREKLASEWERDRNRAKDRRTQSKDGRYRDREETTHGQEFDRPGGRLVSERINRERLDPRFGGPMRDEYSDSSTESDIIRTSRPYRGRVRSSSYTRSRPDRSRILEDSESESGREQRRRYRYQRRHRHGGPTSPLYLPLMSVASPAEKPGKEISKYSSETKNEAAAVPDPARHSLPAASNAHRSEPAPEQNLRRQPTVEAVGEEETSDDQNIATTGEELD